MILSILPGCLYYPPPPLVSKIWDFFARFYYLQKFTIIYMHLPKFTKFTNIYKIYQPFTKIYINLHFCYNMLYLTSKYLQLLDYKSEKDYQKVYFKYKKTKFNFTLPLFGDFQIYNALCSIGIILSSGIGIKECIKSIKKINQIPGRLEKINIPKKLKNNNISIFVDYAHTPDALAKVLKTLKKMK